MLNFLLCFVPSHITIAVVTNNLAKNSLTTLETVLQKYAAKQQIKINKDQSIKI